MEATLNPYGVRPTSARLEHSARPLARGGAVTLPYCSGSGGLGLANRHAVPDGTLLPPPTVHGLRLDDDQGVLEGLRTLAGGSSCSAPPRPRSAAKAAPPPLLAGSSICDRANDRVDGFTERFTVRELAAARAGKTELRCEDVEAREARFLELLESVEGAVQHHIEGEAAATRLRLGELIDMELGPQDLRYFVVALPARVADISVAISCPPACQIPGLFLSLTPGVKPTKTFHDIEGDGGELQFRHEGEPGRSAFVLLVAAGTEPCFGRLRCTGRRPDDEAQSGGCGTASIRRRIEDRLAQLRQDPMELHQRVQAAKEYQRKCKPAPKDFAHTHRRQIADCRPSRRLRGLEQHRELRVERQAIAERRRAECEEAFVARAEKWTHKEEEWRLQKQLEERFHEQNVLLPQAWLQRMSVLVFGHTLLAKFREEKVERAFLQKQMNASRIIQKWMLKKLSIKRRRKMYDGVIAFRIGLMQYVRHMRLAACMAAHSRVLYLLQARQKQEGGPQVVTAVQAFLATVRRIQRFVRRFLRKREARVAALLPHFTAAVAALAYQALDKRRSIIQNNKRSSQQSAQVSPSLCDISETMMPTNSARNRKTQRPSKKFSLLAPNADMLAKGDRRQSGMKADASRRSTKGSIAGPPGNDRRSTVRGSTRIRRGTGEIDMVSLGSDRPSAPESRSPLSNVGVPAFLTAYWQRDDSDDDEDLMPMWFRRIVLRDHIAQMMMSYPERMQKYMVVKKEQEFELETQRWVSGNNNLRLRAQGMAKPPRTVEVSRMPVLYAQTYDDFVGTKRFNDIFHNYRRQVRKVFQAWFRVFRGYGAQYAFGSKSSFQMIGPGSGSPAGIKRSFDKLGTQSEDEVHANFSCGFEATVEDPEEQ